MRLAPLLKKNNNNKIIIIKSRGMSQAESA